MKNGFLDTIRHLLEAFCQNLPARIHHHGDDRDGEGEGVELFLHSYN